MDIYLKEVANKKSRFRFPSLPDKEIVVKSKEKYFKYDIPRKGTFVFPSGPDVQTYSWKGYFFGEHTKKSVINQKWISPLSCIKKLNEWKNKGTLLNMIISGGGVNVDVTIQSFEWKQFGGNGDYSYTISFYVHKLISIKTIKEMGNTSKKKKTTDRANPKKETKAKKEIYEVKPGDNLWNIARKCYGGSGEDWIRIYNANKAAIEKTAKKHGRHDSDEGDWIYPGTILTIPS